MLPVFNLSLVHIYFISRCVIRHVSSYHFNLLRTTSDRNLILLIQIQLSESFLILLRKSSSKINKQFARRDPKLVLKGGLRAAKSTSK